MLTLLLVTLLSSDATAKAAWAWIPAQAKGDLYPVVPPEEWGYTWKPHDSRHGCYGLFLNGHFVGFYDPTTGEYQRYFTRQGVGHWEKDSPPIAAPAYQPSNLPSNQPRYMFRSSGNC